MSMPNLATTLKAEIARVSRKEIRLETQAIKKASLQYRTDIVALKRKVLALERLVHRISKRAPPKVTALAELPDRTMLRFSAKGFATQRKRLGLSAAEMALLLDVSGQSIYKWEKGLARPQVRQMPAITALRTMGKKQATSRLNKLATVSA